MGCRHKCPEGEECTKLQIWWKRRFQMGILEAKVAATDCGMIISVYSLVDLGDKINRFWELGFFEKPSLF